MTRSALVNTVGVRLAIQQYTIKLQSGAVLDCFWFMLFMRSIVTVLYAKGSHVPGVNHAGKPPDAPGGPTGRSGVFAVW